MSTQVRWQIPLVLTFMFLFAFNFCALTQNKIGEAEAYFQSDDQFRVRVDVDLVTTDITVIGNAVSKLKKEDFVVYDNKVAQNINYFSQDQLPIAVALLIDVSGSVAKIESELQIAALAAIRHLKPEDQVVLYSFSATSRRLSDLTDDRLQIAKSLRHLKNSGGDTNIYGALYDVSRYLRKEAPNRRRAIVLISDNVHNTGRDAEKCRIEFLENSIILYSIVLDSRKGLPISIFQERSKWLVSRMAEETGGEVFEVEGQMSVKTALEDAIARLRTQYTLGFNPSNRGQDGEFHSLIVRFADENCCSNCSIIGRKGYYSGVAAPLSLSEKTPVGLPAGLSKSKTAKSKNK